jgi:hypothetical protein
MAKGLNQLDIARSLNVTRQTVARDLKAINRDSDSEYSKIIRESIPTLFENCILGVNEIIKECWGIYVNRTDTSISNWHRMAALRLALDGTSRKFDMMSAGPALMEINRLKSKLEALKNGIENGR